jgi:hypothetical protein
MEQLQTEIEQFRVIGRLSEQVVDALRRKQSGSTRLFRGLFMRDMAADGVLMELPAHFSVQSSEPW